MNMKPIVAVAIALTVGIVTFSGVLIPAIESGVDTDDTFTNKGYFNVAYSTADEVNMSWDHTKPSIVTVNDVDYDLSSINLNGLNQNRITIIAGDNWMVRFQVNTNEISYWSPNKSIYGSITNSIDLSLTASDGSATVTNTASTPNTETISYTELYCIDKEGELIMKDANEIAYLNSDSEIYAIGTTQVGTNPSMIIKIAGNIDDGVSGTTYRVDGATLSNIELNYTESTSYKDLYLLNNITAKVTISDVDYDVTYSYFIVPYEVTAEKSIHADASTILLFQTIPVFIVLGMIVAVVGVLYMKTRR